MGALQKDREKSGRETKRRCEEKELNMFFQKTFQNLCLTIEKFLLLYLENKTQFNCQCALVFICHTFKVGHCFYKGLKNGQRVCVCVCVNLVFRSLCVLTPTQEDDRHKLVSAGRQKGNYKPSLSCPKKARESWMGDG